MDPHAEGCAGSLASNPVSPLGKNLHADALNEHAKSPLLQKPQQPEVPATAGEDLLGSPADWAQFAAAPIDTVADNANTQLAEHEQVLKDVGPDAFSESSAASDNLPKGKCRQHYDREDRDALLPAQQKLKAAGYNYFIYAESSPRELAAFHQRHSFMKLLNSVKEGGNQTNLLSQLWEAEAVAARAPFQTKVSILENKMPVTPRQRPNPATTKVDDDSAAVSAMLAIHTALNEIKESESTFAFVHEQDQPFERIRKVIEFLAHPLHYKYGPLLEDGSQLGLAEITRDLVLDCFEDLLPDAKVQLLAIMSKIVGTEAEMWKGTSRSFESAPLLQKLHDFDPALLATSTHRWLMALHSYARDLSNRLSDWKPFADAIIERLEKFATDNEATKDRKRTAKRGLDILKAFSVKSIPRLRELVAISFRDSQRGKLFEGVCEILSDRDLRAAVDGLPKTNKCVYEDLLKKEPRNSSEQAKEFFLHVVGAHERGAAYRATLVRRLLLEMERRILESPRLDLVLNGAGDHGLRVVDYEPIAGESILFSSKHAYRTEQEHVIDIGIRLDGRLLVTFEKASAATVSWTASLNDDLSHFTGKILRECTVAELLNEDCVIRTACVIDGQNRGVAVKVIKENSAINGFETEIEGFLLRPCKPNYFNVGNIPCQRVGLIWDGYETHLDADSPPPDAHTHRIGEIGHNIATVIDFEDELNCAREASKPLPPLPDAVRVFTTSWFRLNVLPQSNKILQAEWREIAVECELAAKVLNGTCWLYFVPPEEFPHLESVLLKAKLQIKPVNVDEQSFASKLSELRDSEHDGNCVVHLTLGGDVSPEVFGKIVDLAKTTLRIIMIAQPSSYSLYCKCLPQTFVSDSRQSQIYTPDNFSSYASVQKSTITASHRSSTMEQIVGVPPRKICPKLLSETFRDFAVDYREATSAANNSLDNVLKVYPNSPAFVLLHCSSENLLQDYLASNNVTLLKEMGEPLKSRVAISANINTEEFRRFIDFCQASHHTCELVVVVSANGFRSDDFAFFSQGRRAASRCIRLVRHQSTSPHITYSDFENHFPLCQLLSRPACVRLWHELLSLDDTRPLCSEAGQPENVPSTRWPRDDWTEAWAVPYEYSVRETSSTSRAAVLKSDLDAYVLGRKECNWSDVSANGFDSHDGFLLSCLGSMPHRLKLLLALPEVQLNSSLIQLTASPTPIVSTIFGLVREAMACPLVQARLADCQSTDKLLALGILKWGLWKYGSLKLPFAPSELLGALSSTQVQLALPEGPALEDLRRLILPLDEPDGPLESSVLSGQSSIREWVLGLPKAASQEHEDKVVVGSVVQRLLLRIRDPSEKHGWRENTSWGAYEELLWLGQKPDGDSPRRWLSRLSPSALAVLLAATPTQALDASCVPADILVDVCNSTFANYSQYSAPNSAALVERVHGENGETAEQLRSEELIHFRALLEATDNNLRLTFTAAVDCWARLEFSFGQLSVVHSKFKVLLEEEVANSPNADASHFVRVVEHIMGPRKSPTGLFSRNANQLFERMFSTFPRPPLTPIAVFAALWFLAPDAVVPEWLDPFDLCKALQPLKANKDRYHDLVNVVKARTGLYPLFAIAFCDLHEYLDDFTYTLFKEKCDLEDWPVLDDDKTHKRILIAVEDQWPAHTIDIAARTIPGETLHRIGIIKGTFSLSAAQPDLAKARFDFTSGVSRSSVQLNLQALTNGREFRSDKLSNPGDTQLDCDQFFLRMLVVAWFRSFGVSIDVLPQLLKTQDDQNLVTAVINEIKQERNPRPTGNGVWALVFPSTMSSHVQLKSSALQLFGTDDASRAYTALRLQSCYANLDCASAATPAPENPVAAVPTNYESHHAGYQTGCRFTLGCVAPKLEPVGGVAKTPLCNVLTPLSQISNLAREMKRSGSCATQLTDLLRGFVEGSIAASRGSQVVIAYSVSALLVSIGFSNSVAQSCVKCVCEVVVERDGSYVLSTISKLMKYLLEAGFIACELPLASVDMRLHWLDAATILQQNKVLVGDSKVKIDVYRNLPNLPSPVVEHQLTSSGAAPTQELEMLPALATPIAPFLKGKSTTALDTAAQEEIRVRSVACPAVVAADSILSIAVGSSNLNPYFLRLELRSEFSIVLTKHRRSDGSVRYEFMTKIGSGVQVVQKFATSLEAWKYCCCLPPGSVLTCSGFFLRMVATHEWLLYVTFNPYGPAPQRNPLHFLASHKLLGCELGEKTVGLISHLANLVSNHSTIEQFKNFKVRETVPVGDAASGASNNDGEASENLNHDALEDEGIIKPDASEATVTKQKRDRRKLMSRVSDLTVPAEPQAPRPVALEFLYTYDESCESQKSNALAIIRELAAFVNLVNKQRVTSDDKHTSHNLDQSIETAVRIQTPESAALLKKLNTEAEYKGMLVSTISQALSELQAYPAMAELLFSNTVPPEPFVMVLKEDRDELEGAFETAADTVTAWWETAGVPSLDHVGDTHRNPLVLESKGFEVVPSGVGWGFAPITAGLVDFVHTLLNVSVSRGKPISNYFVVRPSLFDHVSLRTFDNRTLAYLFDTRLLDSRVATTNDVSEFKFWLYSVASAPIPPQIQSWLTAMAVSTPHVVPPTLLQSFGAQVTIMVRCLADRCPIKERRHLIMQCLAPQIRQEVSDICVRTDSRYGVVCVTEVSAAFSDRTYSSEYTWIDGRRDEEQFLGIIRAFSPKTTHVVVRQRGEGYVRAPSLLMKWVAEYTEQHPWRFVVFEKFHTHECVSEMRDRILNRVPAPPIRSRFHLIEVSFKDKAELAKEFLAQLSDKGRKKAVPGGDFRVFIMRGVEKDGSFFLLLESAPGLGKTLAIRELRAQMSAMFLRLDASDSRYVTETLIDVLNKTLPWGAEGPPDAENNTPQELKKSSACVLVVDEFHLMRTEQKKWEFANWVRPRLSWLKVVLIANRTDDVDKQIIDELQRQQRAENVHSVRAYMTRDVIDRAYANEKALGNRLDLLRTALMALRFIFGAEASSLRLMPWFCTGTLSEAREAVTRVIADKLTNFGDVAPRAVLANVFDEYIALSAGESIDPKKLHDSIKSAEEPLRLITLVTMYAAVHADRKMDDLKDFEEFAAPLHAIHPVARIHYWCLYLLWHCGIGVADLSDPQAERMLSVLRKMNVVNQDRFPIVVSVGTGCCSLDFCESVLTEGDYSDPAWMASAIAAGKQLNWVLVREQWRTVSSLDPVGLRKLIAAARWKPGELAAALPRGIAFRLLFENIKEPSIRDLLLNHLSHDEISIDCVENNSAFMMAVWCKVKCQNPRDWEKSPTECILACLGRELVAEAICRAYGLSVGGNELIGAAFLVLRWVSENLQLGDQAADDDPRLNISLSRMAALITNRLLRIRHDPSRIRLVRRLWSGSLGAVLPMSTRLFVKSRALTVAPEVTSDENSQEDSLCSDLAEDEYLSLPLMCELLEGMASVPAEWPLAAHHVREVLGDSPTFDSTSTVAKLLSSQLHHNPTRLITALFSSPFAASVDLALLQRILTFKEKPITGDVGLCSTRSALKKNVEQAVVSILHLGDIVLGGSLGDESRLQWQLIHKGDEDVSAQTPQQEGSPQR